MRTMRLAMAALLLCGVAVAQPTGKEAGKDKKATKKSELELILEEVLKGHPDIATAEAKLILARAELEKARRELATKVVTVYHDIQVKKDMLLDAERRLDALNRARAKVTGSISLDDFLFAQVAVSRYKNEVKAAEAVLSLLHGSAGTASKERVAFSPDGKILWSSDSGTVRLWDTRTGKALAWEDYYRRALAKDDVGATMADRIRKAMDKKATINFDGVDRAEALAYLGKIAGLHIKGPGTKGTLTTGDVGEVTLGAAFQLIEDSIEKHRFVVREYGLLFVPEDRIPPGAVTLMAFWKGAPKPADPLAVKKDNVEGKVTDVVKDGLMKLDIGSDAGLSVGDTLEVFRLGTAAKYLGKVKVVNVTAKESVVKEEGKMTGPVLAGDRVARRIAAGR